MRTPTRFALVSLVALALAIAVPALAQTKLLRYPDIHGDRVVFCYAADLWWAPAAGGNAVRLTTDAGIEQFPKYSPDGKWIAFTGQYDGDEQVYVIPADGGPPRQLTFYPARGPLTPRNGWDNQVMGWTRDGKYVLFNTLRDAGGAARRNLYLVPVEGGHEQPLPMYTAGAGDFSPDGKRMVYSPLFHDFRTWKRYEGGWAQDLYLCDLKTLATENITNNPRSDRDPMWIGEKIFFTSDRDGTLNLYSYDLGTKRTNELTHSTTWDVRWPSTDHQSRIVYETDGELHVFQVADAKDTKISINVPTDGVAARPSHYPVEKFIEDFALAPHGERALFVAHGDIFSAPIENGPTRNLTHSTDAHDKWARWSPDGRQVAFISDRSGEEQVWVTGQDGTDEPRQLTTDMKVMLYAPEWAPDSKSIAFSDKNGNLYVLTLADKKVQKVARETRGLINDYAWSPGGSYLAFSLSNVSGFNSVQIWSAADNSLHQVTSEMFNSRQPAWDPDGNYLYYLSDHEFAPLQSRGEANYAIARTTGIYAMALRKDVKNPFPPKSDEVATTDTGEARDAGAAAEKGGEGRGGPGGRDGRGAPGKEGEAKDAKPARPASKPITIDFEGIEGRVAQVPVSFENYNSLSATRGNLLYVKGGSFFNGREPSPRPSLILYSIKDREESVISDNGGNYAVSADGSKVLVQETGKYNLYDAKPKVKEKKAVATKDLYVDRVPSKEWAEIFEETWRRYRDWFYVGNMNGYDWKGIHDQYKSLLPYVAHRWDLTYVLNEMISELNNSHLYIEGGDMETPTRPAYAMPGARFSVDEGAGRYRIARIYGGRNEEEKYRSPLTELGVNAKVGDYVLAIDGQELKSSDNLYERLRDKKDPVTLTLNDKPTMAGAHKTTYKPVASEANLIYLDWVQGNFDKVSKATDGRVGYLHIPDMGAPGIYEFIKWYYPQIRKDGLVVDVRSNGGGNVSEQIIERLNRKLLGTRFGRVRDDAGTYPTTVFTGPMVCLVNETSASDGDIFPYMFQKSGLGPLIGKRTWGGVVGISGRGPLLDGGNAFVPQSGLASPDGKWVIEGHGVDPDIVVENDPASFAAGHDLQLERGIEEVQKLMKTKIAKLPSRPADPVKTQAAMEARIGQKTP
jgi:tricorn protease